MSAEIIDSTAIEIAGASPVAGLYRKLAEVMAEVGTIEAKGLNAFLGVKYVQEDDLFNAIRGKLAERRVVVLPGVVSMTDRAVKVGKAQKDSTLTVVRYVFTFCDGDTGATHSMEWYGAGEDSADKAITMASTSALRTFLLKTFLISTGDDAHGAGMPGAGKMTPTSGGASMSDEQYQGLLDAYTTAGQPLVKLEEFLEGMGVVREMGGQVLSPTQRIHTLNTLEAIALHKKLVALPKAEVPR